VRLNEIQPQFIVPRVDSQKRRLIVNVDHIVDAKGIRFLCPKCFAANGGPKGTHQVICWSPDVDCSWSPGPGRWSLHGSGYDDLSLVAGSSSVQLNGGCNAHFFVTGGAIINV
jgi:hypothetical protein